MKLSSILITGDDGYNSAGIRILVRSLSKDFDVKISGTASQQSGMGGKMTLTAPIKYEEKMLDGVQALCVHGSPVDAIECAQAYYKHPFDLVISGINWGANIGPSFITSGTMATAIRSHGIGLTNKSLALSWDMPPEAWHMDHNSLSSIEGYVEYPGKIAISLIHLCMNQDLWGARMLNINFPKKPTREVLFTNLLTDHRRYYKYPGNLSGGIFSYSKSYSNTLETSTKLDVGALNKGYVSITPCKVSLNDTSIKKAGEKFNI